MSDSAESSPQTIFTRAVGLDVSPDNLIIQHDYGKLSVPWDSITHALAVIHKKKAMATLPLFILVTRDSSSHFVIDGNVLSMKILKGADGMAGDHSLTEMRKSKEDDFKRFIREICNRFTITHIDKPLISYLKGNQLFLPSFITQKEIAEYIDRFISAAEEENVTGAQLLVEEEDLNTISGPQQERKEWPPGAIIEGKYTVQEVLRGGMGTVYIVFDSESIEFYAMKTLQEAFLWNEQIFNQFYNEAEIWVKLERHLHIVQAKLVTKIEGKPYILLEYVQGTDLEALLKEGLLPVKKTIDLALQFCDGMSYAYQKLGLIHRDIKPANCLLTREGILKITDFGLGRIYEKGGPQSAPDTKSLASSSTTGSTSMAGTLPYMAPELFSESNAVGIKTDIYAFGVVLYEMLTGSNPFLSDDPMEVITSHLSLVPDDPREKNPEVPDSLCRLVYKCMDKDASQRYDDFAVIYNELEGIYREFTGDVFIDFIIEETFTEEDWLNKGLSLASLGRQREAILTFDKALRMNPCFLNALIHKGSSLLSFGKILEAMTCLEQAMQINANDWRIWFYRGEGQWKLGRTGEALSCFDRALALAEEKSTVLGRKGILLSELQRYDEALACCDEALASNPRIAEILEEKGNILIVMSRFEEALDCLNRALEINPRSVSALHRQGLALFSLGFFAKAIASQKKVLSLDPEYVAAWVNMGDCHRESGNSREALKAYQTAINMRPEHLDSYFSSILLLNENRQWDAALELLDKALEIDPENTQLLLDRAGVLMHLGNYEDALSYCDLLLDGDPDHMEAKILQHTIQKWLDEQENLFREMMSEGPRTPDFSFPDFNTMISTFCNAADALEHFEKTGEKTPAVNLFRACLHYMEGHYEKAAEMADMAMTDSSLSDEASRIKALVAERLSGGKKKGFLGTFFKKSDNTKRTALELFLMGIEKMNDRNLEEGLEHLKSAIEKDPRLSICYFYVAKILDMAGKNLKALYHYNDFIQHFPASIGYWKERLAHSRISDPHEVKAIFYRWIASYPQDHRSWCAYLIYLAENNYHEMLRLLASGILKPSFTHWKSIENTSLYHILRGFLQVYLSRFRDAMESFNMALEMDQESIPALIGTGKCHEGESRYDRAFEIYRELQEKYPANRYETSDLNAAEQQLIAGQKNHLIYALSGYCLADMRQRQKELDSALSTIDDALIKVSDSLILLNKKAHILIAMQKFPEFFNFYNQLYTMDAQFIPVKVLRSIALMETQKHNDAVTELNNILALDSINLVVLKNLGFIYLLMQNYQKSLTFFDKILSVYSLNYEVFIGKGITCYLMKEYEPARQCFQDALELYPTDPDLWQYLGAVYFHLGHFEASETCWEKALRYRSRFIQGWTNRGTFLYHFGDYTRAQECADRALRINNEYAPAWLIRAQCQWKASTMTDAIRSVDRALTFEPLSARAWSFKGIMEFHQGNYETSLQCFDRAIQLENKSSIIWYNRAVVAMYLKNQSETRRSIDRAAALNPAHAETLIARYIFEKSSCATINEDVYLVPAQKADPAKFQAWQTEYERTGNLLAMLEPLEMTDDPFSLPLTRPLSVMEPVTIFHYLMERSII